MHLILADVALGWMMWGAAVAATALFVVVMLVETLVLRLLDWGTLRRSFLDAVLINIVSVVPGLIAGFFAQIVNVTVATVALTFIVTVVVEGLVLLWVRRHPSWVTWRAALLVNAASYSMIGGVLLAFQWIL